MLQYQSGEIARLRAIELAREAAAHRTVPIRQPGGRPARPSPRLGRARGSAGPRRTAGHAVGVALIRLGMRLADPSEAAVRARL